MDVNDLVQVNHDLYYQVMEKIVIDLESILY